MSSDQIIQLALALLASNGVITSLIVGIFDLVKRKMDKKSGVQKELAEIKDQVQKTDKKLDEHIAQSYRNKILTFQNECIAGVRHTYEQFSEVIEAIENYENHCKENNVNNQKCVLAIEYIKEIYRQCQNTSDFAPMWNTQAIISETEYIRREQA